MRRSEKIIYDSLLSRGTAENIPSDSLLLKKTAYWMMSGDPKDALRAEFWQTMIRFKRYCKIIDNWSDIPKEDRPKCPKDMLKEQVYYMTMYLEFLRQRAIREKVDLNV